MCEGPAARHLSVSARLRRLREYEAARAGPIALAELLFVPALAGDLWGIRSSVTTLVTDDVEPDGQVRVYVQQMPSAVRGIEERHWSVALASGWRVAALDASQDLLVVRDISVRPTVLRLLSLSTGERHPSLSGTGDLFDSTYGGIENAVVFGEYCAAMCGSKAAVCLVIWTWTTGATEIKIPPPHSAPTFTLRSTFTFLSDTHIAILTCDPEALLVYAFHTDTHASGPAQPTVFELPNSAPHGPAWLSPCSDVAGTQHAGFFHPVPAARLLSVAFSVPLHQQSWFQRLELAIPASTLLARVPATEAVSWALWGPKGCALARCYLGPEAPQGAGASAMRLVVQRGDGAMSDDGAPVCALADYCCPRVARGTGGVLVEAFETPESAGWLKAMRPYAVKEFSRPWGSEGDKQHIIIVCEDQLIALEESSDGNSVAKAWACTV